MVINIHMIRHMFRTNIPNIYSVCMFALYRTLFRLSIGKMIFRKHFRKHLFSNLSHDTIILKIYVYKGGVYFDELWKDKCKAERDTGIHKNSPF